MSGHTIYYIDQFGIEYRLNDDINTFLKPGGLRGFGVLKTTMQLEQRPYRSGGVLIGTPYTGERQMEIALQIMLDDWAEVAARNRAMQRNCCAYKDPTTLGALKIVCPDGVTRKIDCWLSEWPDASSEDGPANSDIIPVFLAPSPWFYDPVEQSKAFLLDSPAGVTYPIEYPVEYTTADIDTIITTNNAGDVETWPTLTISGPGQNPTIVNNTTGKTLSLSAGGGIAMDAGDYITIDMDASIVMWYDAGTDTTTSITEKLSDESEFFPLRRGPNALHVTLANSGSGSVLITWYNYYQSLL